MSTPRPPISDKTPSTPGILLTAKELAARLGVSVSLIQRLSAGGRIPRYTFGRRTIRYDLDEVRAALASRGAHPQEPAVGPPQGTPRSAVRRAPAEPVRDLPAYDWSRGARANGTLPPADRRG